jgi:hypothetical protein
LRQTLNVSNYDEKTTLLFLLSISPSDSMAPLLEEPAAGPGTTVVPAPPAALKADTPKEIKKPSGWKLFATVPTQIDIFNQ